MRECLKCLTFETFPWNFILFSANLPQEVKVLAGHVYNCAVLKWVRLWGGISVFLCRIDQYNFYLMMESLQFLTFETFQWNIILFSANLTQEIKVLAGRVYNCTVLKWDRLWGDMGRTGPEADWGWSRRSGSPRDWGCLGRCGHERVNIKVLKLYMFVLY